MSVLEASQHPYLLYGQKKDGRGDLRKSKNLPLILDPSNLHFAPPPVRLPARNNNDDSCLDMSHEKDMDDDEEEEDGEEEIGEGGGGSRTGEHSWARRQFSVLWAPMPSSYQKSKKVSNIKL